MMTQIKHGVAFMVGVLYMLLWWIMITVFNTVKAAPPSTGESMEILILPLTMLILGLVAASLGLISLVVQFLISNWHKS